MKRTLLAMMASTILVAGFASTAIAKDKVIAVSWGTKQEERWKTDEAAIKGAIEAAGNKYIFADAQQSAQKQLADVESLIAQGANAILIFAQDGEAIKPALAKAAAEGIPVIAYDRQIEDPNLLYITFDNVGVGRLMGKTMVEKGKKEGNFAFIEGDPGDPNATFLYNGMMETLKPLIDSGKIKNVCETFTDNWKPDNAQKNMEQCLTKTGNKVDAVMSENDGMASGVVAALTAQGMAGSVPVTGQDGDLAALNRVALGTQLVSVWKDSRVLGKVAGEAANALADGKKVSEMAEGKTFKDGAKKVEMSAILIAPVAVTTENLGDVIKAGWISKEKACAGADPAKVAACK
ncbi:MAG: substrate-binding domain-containing protein [Alphaproteobacteria bacterium]|nr:substrate-binding domain-containing protein [Alphaproteobacteria bacterium]